MVKPRLPKSQRGPNEKLVFVEWTDSCSTHGWLSVGDVSKGAKTCFSVGWVIGEDRHVVRLAASAGLNDTDGFDQIDGQITIPKVAIVRRKTLATKRL